MSAQSYEREHRGSQVADDDQPTPTLSVTVLNYNYARYLPQCLDSILSQTWTDFELILINDCSTDNSLEVIERYAADRRVCVVNHTENKGFVASLIEGAQLSRGKYLTVISADDYCVSPLAFSTILGPLEADEAVALAYSTAGWYTDDGVCQHVFRVQEQSYVRPGIEEFHELLASGHINHSGAVIRATAYQAVGGYDASLRYAVDNVIWLMLCFQGKVAYCDAQLFAYRQHDNNMSSSWQGFRIGIREHMQGIEKAFAVHHDALGVDNAQCRIAIQQYLLAASTMHIFEGRLRDGWYAYWCALEARPFSTAFRVRTVALLVRTVFGPRHYQTLRSMLRPMVLRLREMLRGRKFMANEAHM